MDRDFGQQLRAQWWSLALGLLILVGVPLSMGCAEDRAEQSASEIANPILFPASARLRIRTEDLPQQPSIAFRIPLPEEAIGDAPLEVRVSSTDGRQLEVEGQPAAAPASEIRIALERHWLEPGGYLIQVRTRDRSATPLRRFVLQVE